MLVFLYHDLQKNYRLMRIHKDYMVNTAYKFYTETYCILIV